MKAIKIYLFLVLIFSAVVSCDDQIYPNLDNASPLVSVDAFVNDKPETQVIRVMKTVQYFNNENIVGDIDATVYIIDNQNNRFDFTHIESGIYTWTPLDENGFGVIGNEYTLYVVTSGETFESVTTKKRVPTLDSVTFRFEKAGLGYDDSYLGEFWARDFEGAGDTYWIKAFKNDTLLGKPSEINIAYDAGFSEGGIVDGIVFISPIREAVNEYVEDEDTGNIISPFADEDSLYVEIHSISAETFTFFRQVAEQTNRPGGFGELFASPMSNVITNIKCTSNPNIEAVGFFCVSSVSGNGMRLDVSKVSKDK